MSERESNNVCVCVCERWFLTRNKKGALSRRQEGFQSQTGDMYTSAQTKECASGGGVMFSSGWRLCLR